MLIRPIDFIAHALTCLHIEIRKETSLSKLHEICWSAYLHRVIGSWVWQKNGYKTFSFYSILQQGDLFQASLQAYYCREHCRSQANQYINRIESLLGQQTAVICHAYWTNAQSR